MVFTGDALWAVPRFVEGAPTCYMETLHKRRAERPDIESRVSEQRTASCTSAAERRTSKNIFWGRWVAVKNKPTLKLNTTLLMINANYKTKFKSWCWTHVTFLPASLESWYPPPPTPPHPPYSRAVHSLTTSRYVKQWKKNRPVSDVREAVNVHWYDLRRTAFRSDGGNRPSFLLPPPVVSNLRCRCTFLKKWHVCLQHLL